MNIHIHIHQDSDKIIELLTQIIKNQKTMAQTLDEILADVTEEGTQIDSLVALTAGIKAQLDSVLAGVLTPEQQAKVDAIFTAVESNKTKVVDAINANDSDPNT